MRLYMVCLFLFFFDVAYSQNIQFHYDFRKTIQPELNRKNFPSLSFEYFTDKDSSGSFLFKMQTDFTGDKNNIGQLFMQVSKNLRFWQPKIYCTLNYSGGLGVAPPTYGYYISNSFAVGVSYPFQWKGAWLSASLLYRYNVFAIASHDAQLTLYLGRGFFNYKLLIAGSLVAWTENRNHGNSLTQDEQGKKIAFFGDPQMWLKVKNNFSIGSRINLFYHVISNQNLVQVYPTLGVKYQL